MSDPEAPLPPTPPPEDAPAVVAKEADAKKPTRDLVLIALAAVGTVVLAVAVLAMTRGGARVDTAAAPGSAPAAELRPRGSHAISSLAIEPLALKTVARRESRRRKNDPPPFAETFQYSVKPYLEGRYAEAAERFRDLAVLYPTAPEPLVYAGVCELLLGHAPDAVALLERAAPLTREVFVEDITWYLALAHRAMGAPDGGMMELRILCGAGGEHSAKACAAVREMERAQAPPAGTSAGSR